MKASKFTDAQKAFIIRQGEDGTPVEEICRKAGIIPPVRLQLYIGTVHPIDHTHVALAPASLP